MAYSVIRTGQNITKDCVVGDRAMDRYAVFNGLERVRRIDKNENATIMGVDAATNPTAALDAGAGGITGGGWYAWRAVYASRTYTRPVPVLDDSGNYTRGNMSPGSVTLNIPGANRQVDVTVPGINQAGITHVLLYRSLASATEADAQDGPFFYVAQAVNIVGNVVINDTIADGVVGIVAETDNFPPNAYRYAVAANGYIFALGNFPIGANLTCTVTPGSSVVTLDSGVAFYDGIRGWRFKCTNDGSGGIDDAGLYFVNYVDGQTLQLIDAEGNPVNYDGDLSGSGQLFTTYLPGFVLRWCKFSEPEAWPAENLINFEGDGTGLIQLPNQPVLLVCTDQPTMYTLDLNLVGTTSFKTNKSTVSTEYTATSHYSLCVVDGRVRAIDARKSCIIETDGTNAVNISGSFVPKIFEYLSKDLNAIRLWHCAYDQRQKLFGAFVTFDGAQRLIDFCVGQYTLTGGWFFNLEKDLLCTGYYVHPETEEFMVLGGTEGPGEDHGGVWGRIWCPTVYDEWIPSGSLRSGTITSVANSLSFGVDTTDGDLATIGDGLIGRWVMVCDAKGEYAQVGYIISNTVSGIVVNRVINGLDNTQFSPAPEVGWKFYLGLIECRWGPKKFDFNDPDVLKKVIEIWCCVHNHNEADPPFVRLYRGFETGYAEQLTLTERIYMDNTVNQSLTNKTSGKLEPVPRWGMAWYDRSYGATSLHSLTIVFRPLEELKGK